MTADKDHIRTPTMPAITIFIYMIKVNISKVVAIGSPHKTTRETKDQRTPPMV